MTSTTIFYNDSLLQGVFFERFNTGGTFLSSVDFPPNVLSFPFPFQRALLKQSTRTWPQNSRSLSTLASTRTSSICWVPARGESD